MNASESKPTAVLLMGPTASGKTDLAVDLVARFPLAIVSVDSAMVYRGLDIGTAKPEPEVLARAPHRLIDILDPAEAYSAARFRDDALSEMAAITAAGRVPLLVGGTMLYFRALQQGLAQMPAADPALRARLEAEARAGVDLHQRLARVDPEAAQRIHPNDPQRIQRALEVYLLSGQPWTVLCRKTPAAALPYRLIKIILAPGDRAALHRRIAARFATMLEQGLVEEVRALYGRADLGPEKPAIRSVGYRQVWDYLAGRTGFDEMARRGVVATRQLAKRQMTWLRAEQGAHWLDSLDASHAVQARDLLARELH